MWDKILILSIKYSMYEYKRTIVWHENFTWNLILWFYDQWQNRKIKIRKLDANLVYITTRLRMKLGFRKIRIQTTFHPND